MGEDRKSSAHGQIDAKEALLTQARHWLRPGIAGAGLLQLIHTGLVIAVRKRSGFHNRKRS